MNSNNNQKDTGEPKEAKWGIHWKSPSEMVLLMILTTGCAVGNHVFCQYLDGRPAENQDWMIRACTALATLMKIFLCTMIGIALTQRTWTTVEHQYLPLSSVDGLFAIASNPLKLLDLALLSHAKLSVLLGIFVWAASLIPVLAPGSLTVVWRSDPRTTLQRIPNLNLSIDPFADFQTDKFSLTAKLYDWSLFSANPNRAHGSPVYGGASSLMTAIVNQAMYTGTILQPSSSPCPGGIANCTFTQSFVGPSYKCTPIKPSYPGPQPYYFARNDSTIDFCTKYPAKYSIWGNCTWSSPEADEWQDGTILIDYTYVPPQHRANSSEESLASITSYTKHAYRCEQWRTAYTVTRTFTNNIQSVTIHNFTHLSSIPYWPVMHYGMLNYTGAVDAWASPDPTFDPGAYFSDHGLSMPPLSDNVGYAMHQVMYGLMRGQIAVNVVAVPVTTTRIGGTKLVEDTVWPARDGIQKPREDFASQLEELSRNVTLGLFAVDNLVYLTNSQRRSAVNDEGEQERTLVTEFPYRLVFAYNWVGLWATYGVALLCGVVAIMVGGVSFVRNGVSRDAGFLTFLVTTRGRRMDGIGRGECLGSSPMAEELTKTKVAFGEVEGPHEIWSGSRSSGMSYHAGFGVEGDVRPLRRDRRYV